MTVLRSFPQRLLTSPNRALRGDEELLETARSRLRRLGEDSLAVSAAQMLEARAAYRRFIGLWENADSELQPIVQEARERAAALDAPGDAGL